MTNAIDEVQLTDIPVEYFYQKLQVAAPVSDCCTMLCYMLCSFKVICFLCFSGMPAN